MADRYNLYTGLTGESTLAMIAAFLAAETVELSQKIEFLQLVTLRREIPAGRPTLITELSVPLKESRRQPRDLFDSLYPQFSRESTPAGAVTVPYGNFMPLHEGLPYLLQLEAYLRLAGDQRVIFKRRANLIEDVAMVVTGPLAISQAHELYVQLRSFTTGLRVAPVTYQGRTRFLFEVETGPRSSFDSLQKSGLLDEAEILDTYPVSLAGRQYRIALDTTIITSNTALNNFGQILLSGTAWFGVPDIKDGPLLAVVLSNQPSAQMPMLLLTSDVIFLDSLEVEQFDAAPYVVDAIQNDSTAFQALRHELNQAGNGYRLELRPFRYRSNSTTNRIDTEMARLRQMQQNINERLAELESLQQGQHSKTLLRFTHMQLPYLVDVLRTYAPAQLEQIQYLFFAIGATAHEEEAFTRDPDLRRGIHFLLIDDTLPSIDLDSLILLDEAESNSDSPMHFWYDPVWKQYARQTGKQDAPLFVPHGKRIYPPHPAVHSGTSYSLSEYMGYIFNTPDHAANIEHPMYVVHEDNVSQEYPTPVDVLILDAAKFSPINTPAIMSWINGLLDLFSHDDESQMILQGLSESMAARRIATQLAASADSVEANFQQTSAAVARAIDEKTIQLTDALSQQIETIVQTGSAFITQASAINEQLASLQTLYDQLKFAQSNVEHDITTTTDSAEGLVSHVHWLHERVESQIHEAKREQEAILDIATTALNDIKRTRRRLSDLLNGIGR